VIRACYASSEGWLTTQDRLLTRLRKAVPVDAAFVATADPETLLFSSGWADEPIRPLGPAFLDNEFGAPPDVNRFVDLSRSPRPVATLDEATHGDRAVSPRWRTIMAPIGLGDELRVALRTATATWGFMCLHREGASPFTGAEVSALAQIAPHVAEAMRRSTAALTSPDADGAMVVCENAIVTAYSEGSADLLADIDGPVAIGDPLPLVLRGVLRQLEAIERAPDETKRPAAAVVRTRRGSLIAVHATRLLGSDERHTVVLSLAPPSGPSMAGIRLAAHGLTPAQIKVAKLVLRGQSTREIMSDLRISEHTVQDHLKAIFDRTGVRSRRELVASLMH
jgi:DNA-binding CsgD family transcriptional regulator